MTAPMTTYVSLLRAVNVSGQNMIRMAELKTSFEALGFEEVTTYLQSGNVVFKAGKAEPRRHAASVKARIAKDFGHDVGVLVLTSGELDVIATSNSLWPGPGADEKLFHGTCLFRPVSEDDFRKVKLPVQPGEQAVLAGQVVYLHCPNGYGRTKITNAFFEKALAVPATTRNWRTVLALRGLCGRGA